MRPMVRRRAIYIGSFAGLCIAALTLSVESLASRPANPIAAALQEAAMILMFPGLIGSAIASNNVHAFL